MPCRNRLRYFRSPAQLALPPLAPIFRKATPISLLHAGGWGSLVACLLALSSVASAESTRIVVTPGASETAPAATTVDSPKESASSPTSASLPDPASELWSAEFDIQPESVRVHWKPFPGAVRYFVEVAADPGHQQPLWMASTETTEATIPLGGFVPRGPVFVRFRAVNAQAEELSTFLTSSILGRQTDLPGGIKGIRVRTQETAPPPPSPPPHRRFMQWQPALFSNDLTLISGHFGSDSYDTYLVSNGLSWQGDGPSASVSASTQLLYTGNDRQGFSLNHADLNLTSSLAVFLKHTPLQLFYNNYLYRSFEGANLRNIQNLGMGYQVSRKLSAGAQFTPSPHYLTAWGSYQLTGNRSMVLQLMNTGFSQTVTLSYHSFQSLR